MPSDDTESKRPSRAEMLYALLEEFERSRPGITFRIATPEQKRLRATLFLALFSNHHSHSFDPESGRSFADLRAYISWIAPYEDRLVIGSSSPEVIASYLLPHIATDIDGVRTVIGLPGLRLDSLTPTGLVLSHIPTGAVLELHDSDPEPSTPGRPGCPSGGTARRADMLTHELGWSRGPISDQLQPVYESDEMSDSESDAILPWGAQLELRSALFTRSELLWGGTTGPWIRRSVTSPDAVDLEWRSHVESVDSQKMTKRLTDARFGIDGLEVREGRGRSHPMILRLEEETMFLTNRGGHAGSDWEWRKNHPGVEAFNAEPVPEPSAYILKSMQKSLANFASLKDLADNSRRAQTILNGRK